MATSYSLVESPNYGPSCGMSSRMINNRSWPMSSPLTSSPSLRKMRPLSMTNPTGGTLCHCSTETAKNRREILREGAEFDTVSLTSSPSCAPWINVSVIKKLSKKIVKNGSGDESGERGESEPLLFNGVHGDNIRVTHGGTVAQRLTKVPKSFCKAIVFSDRPLKINERVNVKILGTTPDFSGVIRFGFTHHDPCTMKYNLPIYAVPCLSKKKGFWIKEFVPKDSNFLKKDSILFYYVNQSGKLCYGINGKNLGTFMKYVDIRRPLWAILDIYGSTTAIEFVDLKAHLNNSHQRSSSSRSCENGGASPHLDLGGTLDILDSVSGPSRLNGLSMSIRREQIVPYSSSSSSHAPQSSQHITFHDTCGLNVQMTKHKRVAWRNANTLSNGYVFTSRPLSPGETVTVQIEEVERRLTGSLAFGLTSSDPSSLSPSSLPSDSYYLVDRPEYWIFKKELGSNLHPGDTLSFTLSSSGSLSLAINNGLSSPLMQADTNLPLWAFWDICGSVEKISLLAGSGHRETGGGNGGPSEHSSFLAHSRSYSEYVRGREGRREQTKSECYRERSLPRSSFSKLSERVSSPNLLVSSSSSSSSQFSNLNTSKITKTPLLVSPSRKEGSVSEPVTPLKMHEESKYNKKFSSTPPPPPHSSSSNGHYGGQGERNWAVDCIVCCDSSVDSVFSPCGHLSMCYQCANKYWKAQESPSCPICRATIKDIIRIYKS